MNMDVDSSTTLAKEIKTKSKTQKKAEIVICPPFISINAVKKSLEGSDIEIGAQNMHYEESGAFTGEISPIMLKGICKYVIIGHSERRQIFGETDEQINKKIKSALEHELTPILCVGEKLEERENGLENNVIISQLKTALKNIGKYKVAKIVIAYEPIWAIGTGKNATPKLAQEIHILIRNTIKKEYGTDTAREIRIIYGGSLKPENSKELLSQKDIDGGLIGGASLKSESFIEIIKNC